MAEERTRLLANVALAAANVIFGLGNIVSKVGIADINPVLFALVREGVAGPMLCVLAHCMEGGARPRREDLWRFALCGGGLFLCNFFYIIGIKLGGATSAAVWQPAQPVFITAMAVALKYEAPSALKFAGIFVASLGCLFVSLAPTLLFGQDAGADGGSDLLLGNLMFFLQVLGCSGFYIAEKPLLERYPPITVVGWSYIFASLLMTATVLSINLTPAALDWVCSKCDGDGWHVNATALWAISYWIFLGSICGYLLNTWGNKHVDASLLGAYTVVQPVATVVCSQVVIAATAPPHYGLVALGYGDFGAIAIFAGLFLVVRDNKLNSTRGGATTAGRSDAGWEEGGGSGKEDPLLAHHHELRSG